MYEINRSVFRLVPLQPFWNWLTALPGAELGDLTLEDLQNNANASLTTPCDDGEEVWAEIKPQIDTIFAAELADWCEDDSLWPDLHPDIFAEWFDIRTATVVTDLTAEPLAREAFQPLDLD